MRDLEKDLALHEATTPGKWEVVSRGTRGIDDFKVLVLASFHGIAYEDDCLLITRQCKGLEDVRPARADAKFCAEAHEGWPEATMRARLAEKERDELRARVAKLEAVAKAAKPAAKALRFWLESDIMCECDGGIHNCGYTERVRELNELEQALAALEEA